MSQKVTRFVTDRDPGAFVPEGALSPGSAFGGGLVATAVTDGVTTVLPASELNFTSGVTVTDSGGGVASLAVSGGSPTGSAGGDLSGTYPNPAVAKINGSALGTTTGASTNDVLTWNGSAWVHQAPSGGGSITVKDGSTTVASVTTIDFTSGATVTSGGGGQANVAVSGGGGALAAHPMPLDAYAINGTYGDDFTAASLSGSWTRRNYTSGAETYQVGPESTYLRIAKTGRAAGDGYFRTAPAGDWTFAMAFTAHFAAVTNFAWGVAVVDTNGTGVGTLWYATSPSSPILAQVTTYTSYGGSYVQPGASGTSPNVSTQLGSYVAYELAGKKVWVYLRKSSTSYFMAFSFNGETWSPESSALTWSGTVDRVAMMDGPLGSIDSGSGTGTFVDVDWFNKIA